MSNCSGAVPERYLERYAELKAEFLEVIDVLDTTDVEPWDFVFIDEAQDWPDDERRIVFELYGALNTVVADGQTQLFRTHTHCDWTSGETIKNQKIPLRKALWNSPGFPDTSIMPNWQQEVCDGNKGTAEVYAGIQA